MEIESINNYFSHAHAEVEGWFFPLDQLAFFEVFRMQETLAVTGDVAEVGVYLGKSLILLSLLRNRNERLLGFDLFAEDHYEQCVSNLKKYGVEDEVILSKGLTSDLKRAHLASLIRSPVRFLHIDAGHEYHEVLEQLLLFSPYLAEQGVIAMDDYQDREFPGIEAAVLDFCELDRPRRFVPFLASGNKMFMCAAHMSDSFQKLLLPLPNFLDSCRLTRVRDFNILVMRSKLPVSSHDIEKQIDRVAFPRISEDQESLNSKSTMYSQIGFGAGE